MCKIVVTYEKTGTRRGLFFSFAPLALRIYLPFLLQKHDNFSMLKEVFLQNDHRNTLFLLLDYIGNYTATSINVQSMFSPALPDKVLYVEEIYFSSVFRLRYLLC